MPGRFWTYIGHDYPYSVYDFTESRKRDGPAKFLAGFRGFLHADAYGGYDHIFLGSNASILEVACSAHARRKFFDAAKSSPRESHQVLEWIRQLYDIEDRAHEWTVEDRAALRQRESIPVLARIEGYFNAIEPRRLLPKGLLHKAVSYARNQWQALCRYTEDGRLTIDNNVSERTLRHQAIGARTGCSWAVKRRDRVRRYSSRSWREPSDIGWNRGRTCVTSCCACTRMIRAWMTCCLTGGPREHPNDVLTYRLEESRQRAARQRDRRRQRRALRDPQ